MTHIHSAHKSQAGFTLIELLVVVAILGILAAVGIPQYEGYQAQARLNSTRTTHSNLVNYVSNEFAKCASGAATAVNGTACNDTIANFSTAVATYAAAQNWQNPYDATLPAVEDVAAVPATPVEGTSYLVDDGTDTITITTVWDGGQITADIVKE